MIQGLSRDVLVSHLIRSKWENEGEGRAQLTPARAWLPDFRNVPFLTCSTDAGGNEDLPMMMLQSQKLRYAFRGKLNKTVIVCRNARLFNSKLTMKKTSTSFKRLTVGVTGSDERRVWFRDVSQIQVS